MVPAVVQHIYSDDSRTTYGLAAGFRVMGCVDRASDLLIEASWKPRRLLLGRACDALEMGDVAFEWTSLSPDRTSEHPKRHRQTAIVVGTSTLLRVFGDGFESGETWAWKGDTWGGLSVSWLACDTAIEQHRSLLEKKEEAR